MFFLNLCISLELFNNWASGQIFLLAVSADMLSAETAKTAETLVNILIYFKMFIHIKRKYTNVEIKKNAF